MSEHVFFLVRQHRCVDHLDIAEIKLFIMEVGFKEHDIQFYSKILNNRVTIQILKNAKVIETRHTY